MLVKKIMWMMLSAMVMTVIMVVTITAWTAHKNNERASEDSLRMVQGGLKALFHSLEVMNYDYSAWNAALEAALDRDVEWLSENMGVAATGAEFHFMEIFWPTDGSSLTWNTVVNENETDPLTTPVLPLDVVQKMRERMLSIELGTRDTQSFAIVLGGDVYLVAASRLQPWNEELPVPSEQLPVNFMAYKLTEHSLSELAATFLIDDLVLSREFLTSDRPNVVLNGLEGEQIARLEWTPPRPGDALIKTAALPITAGLIAFLVLSSAVTLMARRNASELIKREQAASSAARTDALTCLPNRMAFNEHFSKLRKKNTGLALLVMDLNGFKAINDEYGHEIGDRFLRRIANLAVISKREEDMLARLGGDEFSIIFTGQNAGQMCIEYCQRLTHQMEALVKIDTLVFQPKIAFGFTVDRSRGTSVSELMRQADYAMYTAKNAKSMEPVKYDVSLEKDKFRENEITNALEYAIAAENELSVAYQPIVDAGSGNMMLAEALVRWDSKKLGSVPPDAFIQIAEKTGVIVEVGRIVIDRVFSDMKVLPKLNVSINLSPVQLRSRSILKDIDSLAKTYGIDPSRVTFEITESTLIEDPDLTSFLLDSLRERGYGLALDDFGIGFSSIGYLRKFHFDKLKIDKSFIDDIGVAENSQNLMKALLYLARSLNMKIVAEGVETEAQRQNLQDQEYDLLQGYLYSKPLSFAALEKYITNGARKPGGTSTSGEVA